MKVIRHPRENFSTRFNNWNVARDGIETERQRVAYLERKPLPSNEARLFELVSVKVLKPFGLGHGNRAQPGQVVELARHDALSMEALNKCTILD